MKQFLGFCLAGLCVISAWGQGAPLLLDWGVIDTSSAEQQKLSQRVKTSPKQPTVQKLSAKGTAPWLVQFNDVIREEWKTAMEATGARLKGYIPENAFLIEATPKQIATIGAMTDVTYVGEFLPEYKRAAKVRAKLACVKAAEEADVASAYRVLLFSGDDLEAVAQKIEVLTGAPVTVAEGEQIRTDLTAAQIEAITGWGEVQWVEAYVPPRLLNDVAVRTNLMNVSNSWTTLGLTGTNQIVAVCDTGLCTGNTNTLHRDFSNKLVWAQALGRTGNWSDTDSHGTHVAGSVLGSGSMSTGKYKGVAYQAKLVFQSVLDSSGGLGGLPDDLNDLFRAAFTNGARIHSDSWGAANAGYYDTDCRNLDMFVWSNKTMLILVAAGNEGIDANSDGVVDADSVDTPGTAKNCLTVGAAESVRPEFSSYTWGSSWPSDFPANPIKDDEISGPDDGINQGLAAFSSRGPCDDGRIKPDIVAPGTDIISTRSKASTNVGWGVVAANTNYLWMGGTSMATPLTAGAMALARQWVMTTGGIADPSAALLKALMINGSRNMSPGQYGTGSYREISATRPDNAQGWGHVDLYGALQPATNQFLDLYDTNSLATGQTNTFTYTVSSGSTNKLIATLTYADYWATAGSGKKLINDLDLTVIKPGGTTNFANGRSSKDATNNVEMVELAADEAGTYTVVVAARTVPSGSPQAYALVVRGPESPAGDPDYGMRDDGGVNLPTLTYWVDGAGSDVTEQGSNFNGRALGERTNVFFKGASIKSWKTGDGNVTGATFSYKAWKTGDSEPAYSNRSVGWTSDDGDGNQTWANFGSEIDVLSGLDAGSYNLKVLFAVSGTGVPGLLSSGPFTATFSIAEQPALDSFAWGAISSPQAVDTPFLATITAKDQFGGTFADFASTAILSAHMASTSTVGAGTAGWIYPMSTYYHDARAQVIYLQSELGGDQRLSGLALDVATAPGQALENWTIRMKHTAMSVHSSASWEGPASGWTTVYQGNATVSATGWAWFEFDAPFDYNGTDNLMVDYSFNNSSYTTDGQVRTTTGAAGRALVARFDSTQGDPLDWIGTSPTAISTNLVPNIQLLTEQDVAMSPAATGSFTNGVWAGMITVEEEGVDVFLRATSGAAIGDSNLFDADGEPPLSAPAAIWASATNATDFTAAWSSVLNATDYRLDVGTNATFSGGGGSEAATNCYHNGTLGAGTGGTWTETGLTQGSGYLVCLTGDVLITPAMDFTVRTSETLTFNARTYGGAVSNNNTITVSISTNNGSNWSTLGTRTPLSTTLTAMMPFDLSVHNGTQVFVKLETLGATASVGAGLDEVLITNLTGGSSAAYVPGYSNRTVAGTSQSVTGLTAGATYFFRARAVNGGGTSPNSPTASVTTASAGTPPTMDAIPAQTTYVGAELDYTVTAQEPDADSVTFACTSAVDEATWEVDGNTGDFLFVPTTNELGTNVFSFTATDKDGTSDPELMNVKVYSAAATNAFTQWVEDQEEDPEDPDFDEGADIDGDGKTTYEEYLADTDPASSNSVLKMEGLTADLDQFSFPASPARFYQLEYCTDITNQAGTLVVSNLGWGVPGMVITNSAQTSWYGVIRALLNDPNP